MDDVVITAGVLTEMIVPVSMAVVDVTELTIES